MTQTRRGFFAALVAPVVALVGFRSGAPVVEKWVYTVLLDDDGDVNILSCVGKDGDGNVVRGWERQSWER